MFFFFFSVESWSYKFDSEMLKARGEVEMEKSKYQKLLSEKRLVEEKLELFEHQSILNASSDGLKRNESDLSLQSFQQNGYLPNGDIQTVSYY